MLMNGRGWYRSVIHDLFRSNVRRLVIIFYDNMCHKYSLCSVLHDLSLSNVNRRLVLVKCEKELANRRLDVIDGCQ